jgi:hypothetical protein
MSQDGGPGHVPEAGDPALAAAAAAQAAAAAAQQQQQHAADQDMHDAEPELQSDIDCKAAQDACKTQKIPKIDGKQTQLTEAECNTALFRLKLHRPKLTLAQLALAFVMCLTGKVMAAVLAHYGPEPLSEGAVAVDELVAFVVRAFGSAKPRTNFSVRERLQRLKPRKSANGSLDLLGYLQEFQQILSQCPDRPDDLTLIAWVLMQLPEAMSLQLQHDPAKPGSEHKDFQVFMQHATTHAAVQQRQQQQDKAANPGDSKRKQNAHTNSNKKAKLGDNRPGFVPGLSKEKRQEMAKDRLCFKCGKPGHISKNCKANK